MSATTSRPHRRRRSRCSRDERGAVAVLTALVTTLLLIMASFAVDLGMQRVVRSDMQALADTVALDAARLLDGRNAGQVRAGDGKHPSLASAVSSSAARNTTSIGEVDGVTGTLVYLTTDANGATVPRRKPSGQLEPVPDAAEPDGVLVSANGSVDYAFRPGSGGAQRTATASAVTAACFELGSFAASVTPANATLFKGLLAPLLGNTVVNAAGYQGLATTSVSLLDVVSAPSLRLGSVDAVLDAPMVKLADLYLASASALEKDGNLVGAQVLKAAAVSAVASTTVDLRKLFALTTAGDEALATRFNVLDLLVGSAFLANGNNLVGIPNLQAGLPSIGVTNTSLSIIERAQRACGDDVAETAQVSLTSDVKLQLPIPILKTPIADLSLIGSDGKPNGETLLRLDTSLAGARGRLTDVSCTPDTFKAEVTTELTRLLLTGGLELKGSVKVDIVLPLLNISVAAVDVPVRFRIRIASNASVAAATTPTVLTYAVPPLAYGTPLTATGQPALPNVSLSLDSTSLVAGPVTVKVLLANVTVPTADLIGLVTPVLNTVIGTISTTVVGPLVNPLVSRVNGYLAQLASGLGIRVAGADFYGLPTPQCNSPRLRG